ncbi:hypothetical protein DV515_00000438, partial [Chloebia gouldiae]
PCSGRPAAASAAPGVGRPPGSAPCPPLCQPRGRSGCFARVRHPRLSLGVSNTLNTPSLHWKVLICFAN